MKLDYDIIIVGAGSAGLSALRQVKKHTDNFVIINDGPWGTTCARVGCMPSKALIEAANAFYRRNTFEAFGILGAEKLSIDKKRVFERVRALRDRFVSGIVEDTESLGERAISAKARLSGPHQVQIGDKKLRAERIILAPGSRSIIPPEWQKLGKRLLTSDTLFDQETIPERMAVIGMGPIGIEVAQALSRIGVQVYGFSRNPFIAGITDPLINQTITDAISHEFPLFLNNKAEVASSPENRAITILAGDQQIEVDGVFAALGRQPNVDDLGLDTLGIAVNDHGLPNVNPSTMQIEDLPIFLAGDANNHLPLLHEAADEGYIAGVNASAGSITCFRRRTPLAITFSDPNIVTVGASFQQLQNKSIGIGQVSFDNQGRARVAQLNRGMLRIYADSKSGQLLGSELCAPAGEHIAHLLALAISQSLTVWDLLQIPFYHPVLEEGLRTALRDLVSNLPPGINRSDLSACPGFNTDVQNKA